MIILEIKSIIIINNKNFTNKINEVLKFKPTPQIFTVIQNC